MCYCALGCCKRGWRLSPLSAGSMQKENAMLQWAKPVITVQNVGMEVTSYAPADMDERDTGI